MRSQDFYMRRQEQDSARSVQFLLVLLGGGAFCVVLGATLLVLLRVGLHSFLPGVARLVSLGDVRFASS